MVEGEWVTAMMTDSGQGRRKGREAGFPSIAAVFWLGGVGEVLLVSRGDWAFEQNRTISWSKEGGRGRWYGEASWW
jgi:hypothetical protein